MKLEIDTILIFPNCKISKICFFFRIVRFRKFLEFLKLEISGILKIGNFWNFPNCKIFRISLIAIFQNF